LKRACLCEGELVLGKESLSWLRRACPGEGKSVVVREAHPGKGKPVLGKKRCLHIVKDRLL
jgi:hypothetical protein